MNLVSIFAVVDQRYPSFMVREIGILLACNLKPRHIPTGVPVSGAPDVSILNVKRGRIRMDVDGEGRAQHAMALLPLH